MIRVFAALVRRELGSHFKSPTGYVVIAAVLFLFGFSLVDLLSKVNGQPLTAPITEVFYATAYFWLILLLTSPVITMRTFALERSSGTFEALMTAPVGDWQVVLAKFAGTHLFFMMTWSPLVACLWVIRAFSNDPSILDLRIIAGTFLGIFLIGSLFVAAGCFASSLTRSQIVAAMLSFILGVALFVVSLRSEIASPLEGPWGTVFDYISMMRHLADFGRGVVDSRAVTFYLTATAFFLDLTRRVVESRRWT